MSHADLINERNQRANHNFHGSWGYRHWLAFQSPKRNSEAAIVGLMQAAANYADLHLASYGSKIGDDGVLGEHWADIVRGILGLLNGDCGRLDCGTLDGTLRDMLAAEGFDRE